MMSFLKDLCSALLKSTDEASAPVATPQKVEVNEPTATESTSVIKQYQGEIHIGTQLSVEDGQFLVALKDGNIVYVLAPGVYTVNDQNAFNLAESKLYYISTKQSDNIKWGTTKPINFTDSKYGDLSLRAMGTYVYRICDVVKFAVDYMSSGASLSVEDYTRNLLLNAVEEVIRQNNGTSYTRLPSVVTNTAVKEQLASTGIDFTVKIEMINFTEESKKKIESAMRNSIQNNS